MWVNLLHLNLFVLKFCNNLCAFLSSFYSTHDLAQTTLYSHFKLVCLLPVIFLISHSSSSTCTVSFWFRHIAGLGKAAVVASLTPGLMFELLSFCAAFFIVVNVLLLLAVVFWSGTTDEWSTECQSYIILIKNAQSALILTSASFALTRAYTVLVICRCINWRMLKYFMLF